MVREGDDASLWARLHARQALVLGLIATLVQFVVLALPLVAVLAIPSVSSGTTIAIYAAGLVADVIVAVAFLTVAIRCAARAARGELFALPVVTAIVDRWFPVKAP